MRDTYTHNAQPSFLQRISSADFLAEWVVCAQDLVTQQGDIAHGDKAYEDYLSPIIDFLNARHSMDTDQAQLSMLLALLDADTQPVMLQSNENRYLIAASLEVYLQKEYAKFVKDDEFCIHPFVDVSPVSGVTFKSNRGSNSPP